MARKASYNNWQLMLIEDFKKDFKRYLIYKNTVKDDFPNPYTSQCIELEKGMLKNKISLKAIERFKEEVRNEIKESIMEE